MVSPQATAPLFFICIVTDMVWPGLSVAGMFCDMNWALRPPPPPPPITSTATFVLDDPNEPTPLCSIPH